MADAAPCVLAFVPRAAPCVAGPAIVPYRPAHALALDLQPAQAALGRPGAAEAEGLAGPTAWTLLVDGRPMACAGWQENWPGHLCGWALLARDAGSWLGRLTRAVQRLVDHADARRFEVLTPVAHHAASRWMRLLGFELEGLARRWGPIDIDVHIWARTRERGKP